MAACSADRPRTTVPWSMPRSNAWASPRWPTSPRTGFRAAIHQAFKLVRVGGRVQMLGIPAKPMDVDFATEVIFKGITIYGVVGRRMYDTWIQMTQFLRAKQFDPTAVITHRFPLEQHAEAIAVIKSGEAGKVVFEIS